jgi:phosphate transport system substrate-binding protein
MANGVTPVEVQIGFDGIVLANAKSGATFAVSREQIFMALAKEVIHDGAKVSNPYTKWSEIDPSLPASKIEVLGPPPTSGTRDAFVELVMEEACQNADILQGSTVDGVEPTFENIAAGDYPVSRSLYFYIKKEHVGVIPGIAEYVAAFTAESAWGDDGYLTEKGLIPLSGDQRDQVKAEAEGLVAVKKMN